MKLTAVRSITLFLVFAFFVTVNAWGATATTSVEEYLDTLIHQMVDPSLDSIPEAYGPAPGAILQVDGPDLQYLGTAGFANLEKKTPVNQNDRFEIGSNTKMFTAVLLIQLAEQGVLGLDDPLSKWLPEWAAKFPNGDIMSLRQLANHTTGIWDYADAIIGAAEKDDVSMRRHYTPVELLQFAVDNGTPDFLPGEAGKWKYSNTGYILLGVVLEKASGETYADLLRKRIFEPLQLQATSFPDDVPETDTVVQGYVSYPDGKNTTAWNLSQGWAAGGIISTAADMRIFLQALANGRLFKDQSTLLAMAEFVESGAVSEHIGAKGYGLGLIEFTNGVWGHGGQTLGHESEMRFVPGTDITMVALTNAAYGPILQMRTMAPVLQKIAGIEPQSAAVFPRPEPDYDGKRGLDFAPFIKDLNTLSGARIRQLDELLIPASIPQIQALMDNGKLTARELTLYCMARIQVYDMNLLNSVMELNPEALEMAGQLDRERVAGKVRGPMHGIPVLLKDNIAVHGMHATAGAWAMRNWMPARDARLVSNLRAAGAVILGKTNLSEWANYMDPAMPSGFSVLGGQTRNPYGPYEVWGSSSGSAVAASARFAPVTVGTETQGSIIMPAAINGAVAIKTSKGLVDGDNIIPLADWMDVPGPMTRTVSDAAILLTAMVGAQGKTSTDYTRFLNPEAARGMRIGIEVFAEESATKRAQEYGLPENQLEGAINQLLEQSRLARQLAAPFSGTGVEVIEVDTSELPLGSLTFELLPYAFRDSLDRFLKGLGDSAPVASLAGVIKVNKQDLKNHAPYGQQFLSGAQDTTMTEKEYAALVSESKDTATKALGDVFKKHNIKALITGNQLYAAAGFPAITVPAGYKEDGEPYALTLVGEFRGEPDLIAAAYAFEKAAQARKEPDLDATVRQILDLGSLWKNRELTPWGQSAFVPVCNAAPALRRAKGAGCHR